MIQNVSAILEQFGASLAARGETFDVTSIGWDRQPAPHRAHDLPPNSGAVYAFTLSEAQGKVCPVGPHRALKIGIAGPNSNARFRGQHYSPQAAGSTLARSLLGDTAFWPALNIQHLSLESVGKWIRQNTDRDNFYIADNLARSRLELFLHSELDPLYEGGPASLRFTLDGRRL